MTEGSAETAGAEVPSTSVEVVGLSADEVRVVMTDGSPEIGAELKPASVGLELSDAIAEVRVAEVLMISDEDIAKLDSSRPVEEALAIDEVTEDGAAETVPFPAIPECEGLLHLPLPCPAT